MNKLIISIALLMASVHSFALTDSTALLLCTQDNKNDEFKVIYPLKPQNNSSPVFIKLSTKNVYMTNEDGSQFIDYYIGVAETDIEYGLNDELIKDYKAMGQHVGKILMKGCDHDGNALVFTYYCKTIRN